MENKDRKAILTSALKKIEKGWTQGCSFRDSEGKMIGTYGPFGSERDVQAASSFCSYGAIRAAEYEYGREHGGIKVYSSGAFDVLTKAVIEFCRDNCTFYSGVVDFNDQTDRKKEEVIAVFNEAIAMCDQEPVND